MATLLTVGQSTPSGRTLPRGAMAIRTLLVHVCAEAQDLPRLRSAADLARRLDATLFGLGCEMAPPMDVIDPSGLMQAEWYAEMLKHAKAKLERARELFHAETEGLRTEWVSTQDMPAQALTRLSRGADLIMTGGHPLAETDPYRGVDTTEVMLHAGRPVLVAPPNGGRLHADAVVVAWKDTREARRALADALPLLLGAESVLVMQVCERDSVEDAESAVAGVVGGLQRHDIDAHGRVVVAPPNRIVAELNIAAGALGADLIVSGGYGHRRIGEWVFGGVTRDLLQHPERFVLLSH